MKSVIAISIICLLCVLLAWGLTARTEGTEVRDLAIVLFRHEKLNLAMQRALFKMNEGQMNAFQILANAIWGKNSETDAVFDKLNIQFLLMNQQLNQLEEMTRLEMKRFRISEDELPFTFEGKEISKE